MPRLVQEKVEPISFTKWGSLSKNYVSLMFGSKCQSAANCCLIRGSVHFVRSAIS